MRLTAILPAFGAEPGDVALISVDDEPPRPFRLGATIKDDLFVQDVGSQTVQLASRQSGDVIVLELPLSGRTVPAAAVAARDRTTVGSATAVSEAHFDASPIVPPHPEMTAPRAADAGTPGSYWARMREEHREATTGSVERAERGPDPVRR
jgi:hypothetical protein